MGKYHIEIKDFYNMINSESRRKNPGSLGAAKPPGRFAASSLPQAFSSDPYSCYGSSAFLPRPWAGKDARGTLFRFRGHEMSWLSKPDHGHAQQVPTLQGTKAIVGRSAARPYGSSSATHPVRSSVVGSSPLNSRQYEPARWISPYLTGRG